MRILCRLGGRRVVPVFVSVIYTFTRNKDLGNRRSLRIF